MGFISDFMNADHQQLGQEWLEFKSALAKQQLAPDLFQIFFLHLNKHIILENDVLFDRFEEYLGVSKDTGPTTILRKDHQTLQRLLAAVKGACIIGNIAKAEYASLHLQRALDVHTERENAVPYPLFDKFISKEELKAALEKIYQ